jgi:hypothetical protein
MAASKAKVESGGFDSYILGFCKGYSFVSAFCKMQIYFRQFANTEIYASVIVNVWQSFAEMSAVSRKGENHCVPTPGTVFLNF